MKNKTERLNFIEEGILGEMCLYETCCASNYRLKTKLLISLAYVYDAQYEAMEDYLK